METAGGGARGRALQIVHAVIAMLACAGTASAQEGKLPWEEYGRLMEKAGAIAPLESGTLFGDAVDLYSGGLSLAATDVSVPGNGGLPVAIGRKLAIRDRSEYGGTHDYAFADWDIDIPNVGGVFAGTWHDSRCSQPVPPTVGSLVPVQADEYWAGNQADMPGGGEMLRADVERTKPASGGPYSWVTEGNTYFSCLSSIANGSGEGFLAITDDGTRYWFNYMAQYFEPSYTKPSGTAYSETITRRRNVLYATRVEDRFGNWVTYSYSNAATAPVRLTQVSASDGRKLTLQYNASGYVSSISDGSRTWSYQYSGNVLSKVVLPDASSWTLNLAALSNAELQYSTESSVARSCFSLNAPISGDVSGSMTHPSGAVATFTVGPQQVGLTNVPGVCRNYELSGAGATTNDDFPVIPFRWFAPVIKSKRVEGPGLAAATWNYAFQSGLSWQYPPGQTTPVCTTTTCLDPVCKSDDCAGIRRMTITGPDGEWQRYTFGNSYRYNEGKLLMHERGASASSILKTVLNTYNYATSGQPYPAKIGSSPQPRGAGFVSEYPRPLVTSETYQDEALFVWKVDTGCTASGVYCLDGLARPTRVVRQATLSTTTIGTDPVLPPSAAPTLTAPATNATGNYTISWTAVSLASWYELQERLGTAAWDTVQSSGATSAAMGGKPSGSWGYQVRACNVAGCSAWSAAKTTVVTLPPTSAPTLSAPATSATGSYTVSWTAVAAATRYELEQRKDGGAWAVVQSTAATSRAFSTQAVGSYDYRVRACNAGGCAGYSAIATTVVPQSLSAPTLTMPSSVTQGEAVSASWTAVSGANRYVLEHNRNGGTFSVDYDGTATSASVTPALAGSYKFRVKACNASGCSDYSAEKTVTVKASTAAIPTDITRLVALAVMEDAR